MPTKMDRDQWTDVWEHSQEKLLVLRFSSQSEKTELSVSNSVCTFIKERDFVSRYLVSMIVA